MSPHRVLLALLLGLAPIGTAAACAEPERAEFRDIVATAPTIFTFQLTSAYYIRKPLGDNVYTEYIVGLIRVVEPLKGDADSFRLVRYGFRSCGATRMSVGQFYLAATSQRGPVLNLWGTDNAVLDLTLDFYRDERMRTPAVDTVREIIDGAPVPTDFPSEDLVTPLIVYPAPPQPPG